MLFCWKKNRSVENHELKITFWAWVQVVQSFIGIHYYWQNLHMISVKKQQDETELLRYFQTYQDVSDNTFTKMSEFISNM